MSFMGLDDTTQGCAAHLIERLHASMLLHRQARTEKVN